MEKFLSDLKQTVNSAVKKSGELVEVTKLKMAAGDTKRELQTQFIKLGELVYLTAKSDEPQESGAEEIIAKIDELKETLRQQETHIADLTSKKVCPGCGKMSEDTASFCAACGEKFV
ncbi:MAG: hypothetical protein E7414_00605 [Ruminococcaceae bacterium]|nr:hypothetical protein [Oscillospiraceae bacterium]